MSVDEQAATERVIQARERYVARGVSTPRLVVSRAEGAKIWDADGREYLDFAGGIALPEPRPRPGRGRARGSRAGRPLPPPVLHGRDRTSRTSRSPAARRALARRCGDEVAARQLRRRGDRERREDRPRRDRARRRRRLRPRLPRPHDADDDDDLEGRLQAGLRAVRARRSTARPRRTRIAASRRTTRSRALELLLQAGRRPGRRRVRGARAGAGRRRLHPDAASTSSARSTSCCDRHGILYVDDEVQSGGGRTGAIWAIEHYDVEPDLLVAGKSLGGGLPLASVTGRAELMDAVHPGGLGGTFGGNPARVRCRQRHARRAPAPGYCERAERSRGSSATRLDAIAARNRSSATCAGSARCSRSSSPSRHPTPRTRCSPPRANRAHPPLLRSLRERHPPAAAALGDGRGARARPRRSWRRRLATQAPAGPRVAAAAAEAEVRLTASARPTATVEAVAGVDFEVGEGRVLHAARPVGLGEDDDAPPDRGLRAPRRGQDRARRRRTSPGSPPYERDVNTVFQDYALFPHMTVAENVDYGLRVRKGVGRTRAPAGRRGARDGAPRQATATASPSSSPAASASASRSRARSSTARRCSCSTSRSARST